MPPRHVLSAADFDRRLIDALFAAADRLRATVERGQAPHHLRGRKIGLLFDESSTRTVESFHEAAELLGARVRKINLAHSSVSKGESIKNTVRTLEALRFDALVIRHADKDLVHRAARAASIPVLNAGNGADEHPSQALLDLYTILRTMPKRDELTMAVCGDLRYGRAVRSLLRLMVRYWDGAYCPFGIALCSSEELSLAPEILEEFGRSSIVHLQCTSEHEEVLLAADIVYMTRVQKERLTGRVAVSPIRIDAALTAKMPTDVPILHPMPWIDEIAQDAEDDPRLRAFDQVRNGIFVRMALLCWVLDPTTPLFPSQP